MDITREIIRGGQLDMAITLAIIIAAFILMLLCALKWESVEGGLFFFAMFVVFVLFFLTIAFKQERHYIEAEVTDYGTVQEMGYRILSHKEGNLYLLEKTD